MPSSSFVIAIDGPAGVGKRLTAVAMAQAINCLQPVATAAFERDACGECGNFTLVRNGTCMKCDTCGSTSGCS